MAQRTGGKPQLSLPQLGTLLSPHLSLLPRTASTRRDPVRVETMPTDDKEKLLDYAINHIFLPPRLPNASDHSPHLEAGLITLVRDFAEKFVQVEDVQSTDWVTVTRMLASMSRVHDGGTMSEHTVAKEIDAMQCGDVLPIYIASQNAAIILRRPLDDRKILTVESFEVAPKDCNITHTEGKLCIVYPSVGRLSIPLDPKVTTSLAQFIVYHERNPIADAKAYRGVTNQNSQDTSSPRFITELLTGTIRGYFIQPAETQRETVFISKRIDNHVLCSRDSEAPWRRSPIWLVIRVALQTTMHERQTDQRIGYKAFILHIFSSLLEDSFSHRPDHLLSVMNARLGRRICKAPEAIDKGCFAWGAAVCVNRVIAEELEKRWKRIQTTRDISWNAPTEQDLISAAHFGFDKSALKQLPEQESAWEIPGGNKYAIRPVDLNSALPPKLANISSVPLERTIHLYDFECWVAQQLAAPAVNEMLKLEAALKLEVALKLDVALTEYKCIALQHYKGDPERMSIALLTVLEIWVAVDRIITAWQPKLLRYSPEVPEKVLECLLLPRCDQMKRLSCVEIYLTDRHRKSHGESSIFYDTTDTNSFVNWFFNQSKSMQDLLRKMKDDAEQQRTAKREEIEKINATCQRLKCEIEEKTCDKFLGHGTVWEHSPSCEKCELEKELKALRITVFESPIPENEETQKCVVFELQPPKEFSIWRNITSTVLSICSGGEKPTMNGKPWRIDSYDGYSHHFDVPYPAQGITLAAWRKRYDNTCSPPVSYDDVIKPHSMSEYQPVDEYTWATNPFRSTCSLQHIRTMCTMKVDPRGPYASLQFAVSDTTHTSNQIIASQDECSIDITLHDYEAFSHLRAGHKLQWRNMLRELRRQVLSISNHDVHILFLQAIWQAGPRAQDHTWYREAHRDLTEQGFLEDVHSEISEILKEIKPSWNRAYACGVLIIIAARIISVADDVEIRGRFIQFLRDARSVAHTWLKDIMAQYDESPSRGIRKDESAKEMAKWQRHILLVAMVCRSTFNVDDSFVDTLLASSEDVATFVECGNAIHISKPPSLGALPFAMRSMYHRDQLLAVRLLPKLMDRIQLCDKGLDDGIYTIWKSHTKGQSWTILPVPHERWCAARTKGGDGVEVHFNLLDGTLYVGDKTFGKLPDVYTKHPTYRRLFGEGYVLQTTRSTMHRVGMNYAAKSEISSWEVHFCLSGEDLVIRTRKGKKIFELIPDNELENVLPRALIVNYTHWYDAQTGFIDLRPLSTPWQPNLRESWSTDVPFHDQVAFGRRQEDGSRRFLVDQNHPRARAIHKIFAPLESCAHNLLISFKASPSSNWKPQQLEISLPRYKLTFVATDQGVLECLSYRGFILDCDEDLGTLYGLKTKLVLCRVSGVEKERKVIIPKGPVRIDSDGNKHPRISIDIAPDALFVEYYTYQVDDLLHRLIDTTLESRIHRLYLHALTSHPLVDPLTGHTGTEEALQGLSRASTISFQSLSGTEISLLEEFGKLTPRRELYSKETKSMQMVEWNPFLPPNVQHHDFVGAVRKIWDYWVAIRVFLPEFREGGRNDAFLPEYKKGGHEELNKRAGFRHRLLIPLGPYETSLTPKDAKYTPRDSLASSNSASREAMVFEMSRLVQVWPSELRASCHLRRTMQGWQVLSANCPEINLDYSSAALDTSLKATWRSLYDLCRRADRSADQSKLTFLLSSLMYRHPDQTQLYRALLAFATNQAFRGLQHDPPESGDLNISDGETPRRDKLVSLVSELITPFLESPEYEAVIDSGYLPELEPKQRAKYASHRRKELGDCVAGLTKLEYCGHIPGRIFDSFELISGDLSEIEKLFNSCYDNRDFLQHIDRVQDELDGARSSPTIETEFTWVQQPFSFSPSRLPSVSWSILLVDRQFTPPQFAVEILLSKFNVATAPTATDFQHRYAKALRQSIVAYQQLPIGSRASSRVEYERRLLALESLLKHIKTSLAPISEKDVVLLESGLWPRITPRNLLAMLNISRRHSLQRQWKGAIVEYAKAVTMVQRAKRISKLGQTECEAEREGELTNTGRIGWDPMENVDWLLVELESNLLIRSIQAKIATKMLRPAKGRNSVMQMNMGEGKSSVVVPIISASLADQSQLVRVVVLKPLARQMFHILTRTLGKLTNRRIFYLPLDRSLKLTPTLAQGIHTLFKECALVGGILLCQPEHILSFKLMALEALSSDPTSSLTKDLVSIQQWLEGHARDILDESDEILSPKYQLTYTLGTQHNPDGEFIRWKVVQEVLSLLKDHVKSHMKSHVKSPDCEGVELQRDALPQQFPQIRVIARECGMSLFQSIAESIIFDDKLPSLSFRHSPSSTRHAILDYITQPIDPNTQLQQVEFICDANLTQDPAILKMILLLRGLLGHGVLLAVLKDKRWRVDYGLDTTRSMLAVPYRAKDCPSSRAEFGHTDVAIALTCLTYYYKGLEEAQLMLSFEQLFKTDNPSLTYDEWTRDCPSTSNLPKLHDLNLDDPVQWRLDIFPTLQYCKATIDFFLATIVFPKHMKEFPHKLSTSGWDLVQDRSSIGRLVTGFSGTNDNCFLLPTTVKQVNLPDHQSTNATVLDFLLQEENAQVVHSDYAQHNVEKLLELLRDSQPTTRVLLDVGAQVVKHSNLEVAKLWLKVDGRVEAAIFVNSDDELCVVRKSGSVELLVASPYLEQLGRCVVYLDEAHTRGTDLKLPPGWKAAVTLGPRLCKDKLVQGCMRMRKLGSTHSVFFLASKEVRGYITAMTGTPADKITSEAVLTWSMIEATVQMQIHVTLWANQGFSFADRQSAWEAHKAGAPIELPKAFREKESRTLNELYGSGRIGLMGPQEAGHDELKEKIRERCKSFGIHPAQDARINEEQEREVAQEKDEERQIERPPPALPLKHRLSDDIEYFISTGVLRTYSKGIIPALCSLSQTTLESFAKQSGADAFPYIWVTKDFASTIQTTTSNNAASVIRDDFLRSIQWVLSSTKERRLVLLSPFEANALVDDIRESPFVTLRVYSPQTSWNIRPFENLRSFMIPHRKPILDIPSHVINELNLFAGQLYFASKEIYEETCEILGLYLRNPPANLNNAIDATGFVRDPRARKILGLQCAQFSENPIEFLRTLTGLRRKGQGFLPTHLGKVLHSRDVPDSEFKRP